MSYKAFYEEYKRVKPTVGKYYSFVGYRMAAIIFSTNMFTTFIQSKHTPDSFDKNAATTILKTLVYGYLWPVACFGITKDIVNGITNRGPAPEYVNTYGFGSINKNGIFQHFFIEIIPRQDNKLI